METTPVSARPASRTTTPDQVGLGQEPDTCVPGCIRGASEVKRLANAHEVVDLLRSWSELQVRLEGRRRGPSAAVDVDAWTRNACQQSSAPPRTDQVTVGQDREFRPGAGRRTLKAPQWVAEHLDNQGTGSGTDSRIDTEGKTWLGLYPMRGQLDCWMATAGRTALLRSTWLVD